ncbi:MAG: hypothetical protein ACU83V_00515, partial [Gammaproteobacteria bacterium]
MKPPTKIIRILALVLIGIQINGCGTFMATELHCLSGCSRVYLATRTDIHVLSLVFSDDLETPNNCISCCFNVSAQDFPSSSLKDSNVVEAGVHLFLFGLSL